MPEGALMPVRLPDQPRPAHSPMTGWYDPRRLVAIGIRVAEATIFGKMFDRRELMASLDPFDQTFFEQNFDFTDKLPDPNHSHPQKYTDEQGDFWFDYLADTGDGWAPAHAVARLLARQNLDVSGLLLPQGRVLVLGGDQVYPTASAEDYAAKLQEPYKAANLQENKDTPESRFDHARAEFRDRYVFALPGNHDWYDDLTAFTHLFCNKAPDRPGATRSPGRSVCGRETRQTRSYFALKLPHDWWLCAFDAQLEGYIDAPQLRFFEHVAQNLMAPHSNVILCTAGPVWAYCRGGEVAEGFRNFAFASLIVTGAQGYKDYEPQRQHNLRLVLTGDSHHYAHFVERAHNTPAQIHYLTCGLGGAFTHPTHWLQPTCPEVSWRPPPPLLPYRPGMANPGKDKVQRRYELETYKENQRREKTDIVYPDRVTSRCLTWRNLFFGWLNPWFGTFLGAIALIAGWLLHAAAEVQGMRLLDVVQQPALSAAIGDVIRILVVTPWPSLVILGITAALYYFADHKNLLVRLSAGILHAAAHVSEFFLLLFLIGRWLLPNDANEVWLVVIVAAAEAILGPAIMGLYLLIALNVFHRHWNEAFSSLRIANFKGFLRLKIDARGDLTVYPIVLDQVPHFDAGALNPRFVEEPIAINKDPFAPTNRNRQPAHSAAASPAVHT